MFFTKKERPIKELFTYFTPNPPLRNKGYREKELDLVAQLFTTYNIQYKITSTIPGETGFWTIFEFSGTHEAMHALKNSPEYNEYKLTPLNQEYSQEVEENQLELISEGDEQFENLDNYKL